MVLKRIGPTAYESTFPRARARVGGPAEDVFCPEVELDIWDGECKMRCRLDDRPYLEVTDDPDKTEAERIVLAEGVHYPPYEVGVWYEAGDLLSYDGGLYEVVQGHTSQADWPPDQVPALYTTSTPPGVIAPWSQPAGAHDAYAEGALVSYGGRVWESVIADNVWEPGVYGWQETSGRQRVELYPLPADEQAEEGKFEFEVVLTGPPPDNKLVFDIEVENLRFLYQPELTQEEIDADVERPENVVGSYAVYHATKGNIHRGQAEAAKYRCGKAFHIYRPLVRDVRGNETWGELSIDEAAGTLTVEIDSDWLAGASYPVSVDPTFGNTEIGATSYPMANMIEGSHFTAPETGSGLSVTRYGQLSGWSGGGTVMGVYRLDDYSFVAETETITDADDEDYWLTLDFLSPPSFVEETDYILVCWRGWSVEGEAGRLYGDTGHTEAGREEQSTFGQDWPDPANFDTTDVLYSIYTTYEPGEIVVIRPTVATHETTNIEPMGG